MWLTRGIAWASIDGTTWAPVQEREASLSEPPLSLTQQPLLAIQARLSTTPTKGAFKAHKTTRTSASPLSFITRVWFMATQWVPTPLRPMSFLISTLQEDHSKHEQGETLCKNDPLEQYWWTFFRSLIIKYKLCSHMEKKTRFWMQMSSAHAPWTAWCTSLLGNRRWGAKTRATPAGQQCRWKRGAAWPPEW